MTREDLNRLVTEHETALTRLCLKLCRSNADAEDLYQETWRRAVEKIQLFDDTKPFQPWLFTICINVFRNAYRKSKNAPVTDFSSDEEKERAIDNAAISGPVFNEEHSLIRDIVNELDEKYRIVIVLHYFSDYSTEELAAIIGIPQGTVKSRLHKARKIIKGRLEDDGSKNI